MTAANANADALLSLSNYYLPVYRPRQLVLERGQGARLWDTQGREFIDLAAGIAVCSLGHNNPELKAALFEQADKLWHTSNMFYSEPPLHLAQELVDASRFASRVFLCNSGAEANEVAIKLARKYGNRVITLANGMVASDTAHPEVARRYAAAMAEREADEYDDDAYDDED